MNMKRNALLFLSLWALSCARPVSRHHGAHHRSSEEHWATAADESLNEVADSTDVNDEDISSTFSMSSEARRKDPGDGDSDSRSTEGFPRKVSSLSLESHPGDDHEWSTRDNEDDYHFRLHQTFHRKWAENEDAHDHSYLKETNGDSSDDQPADRMSLDQNQVHSDTRKSKEQFDVENDGMLYTPDQVLYTFVGKGGSDLTHDEDISGDDAFERHNEEDPGYTVPPGERDEQQNLVTDGEQDGDNAIGRHPADSSSSSSSSESRSLDKEDNHITDYGKRRESDSYSSSQEDRYDFDDEGMQGDDPRIFDSHDSHSYMLHGDVHSKESSQDISREKWKGKGRHHRKLIEHFSRKVYHYVDADSEEDHSPEQEESKSLQEDEVVSKEESQSVEDFRESTENVPSKSKEDVASHSRDTVKSSSRGHRHSQSQENIKSRSREEDRHSRSREEDRHSRSREEDKHSRSREEDRQGQSREEDRHSRSREEDKHSRSREEDRHSRSREEDKHSQSREEDRHSRSREEDRHSRSREEDKHSQSREEDRHSRSREDDRHSRSREEDRHSRSREEDRHSRSREEDRHSQSREEDRPSWSREDIHSHSREIIASQSREDENSHSREEDDMVSTEDLRSESHEDSTSHEKDIEKSKEISDKSDEHSASKSKEQESYSAEDTGNVTPRGSESREVKRHHSRSSEKSTSTEESEESPEDTNESSQADSRSSHSASSESSKASEESEGSDDSDSHLRSEERQPQQNLSTETSESTEEENSYSIERDSHSRENTASSEGDSWSRSMELDNRKLMFNIDHNKPLSDYDDNDCQDGY